MYLLGAFIIGSTVFCGVLSPGLFLKAIFFGFSALFFSLFFFWTIMDAKDDLLDAISDLKESIKNK